MVVKRLRAGQKAVGTMARVLREPALASVAHQGGLDFIMLDLEHGAYNLETVADIFNVGRALGLGCFVRVPELTRGYVSRILDAGATGVMVPMVESAPQAELLAKWAKYPPLGGRGYGGIGGHSDYGTVSTEETSNFMARANENTLTIAQIETAPAIAHIEAIAAVPGIDALLIGPNDLSISLGCPGDLLGEVVDKAIGKVARAAADHGKIFGLHAPDALLDRWIPQGCRLIMSNLDVNILVAGMKAIAGRYKS